MIGILHLSDMHLKIKKEENPILKRIPQIVDSVKNEITGCTDLIIIFSGDIAFSGKKEEYDIAKSFFAELTKSIINEVKVWIRILFVPGNHDCNFTPNSVREAIMAQAITGQLEFDHNVVEVLCETQKEYFRFVKEMGKWRRKMKTTYTNKLYSQYIIEIKNVTFKIDCFNSASFSKLKETPGNLNFPIDNFEEYLQPNKENISIAVLHHPLNWLSGESHKKLKNKLIEISDIVLTGHEHIPDELTIKRKKDSAKFIESGALQDNSDNKISQFGLLVIDVESVNIDTNYKLFSLDLSNGYLQKDSVDYSISKIKTKRKVLLLKENFNEWLEELGAPIAHPRKEESYLNDFYVAPDVQVVIDPDEDNAQNVSSEYSSEKLLNEKYCILIGPESSGKTTFLKNVFKYKFEQELIPILIEGEEIKGYNLKTFYKKNLKKAFNNQYFAPSSEYFDKIDRSKIVILIDNFGACGLSEEYRKNLIKNLDSWFGEIFITARELIHFDPIRTGEVFDNFIVRRLLELNHELRKKIISKWNILGQSINPQIEEELAHKNLESIRFINNILQKHFTEPYPIYILTLLQVQDANSTSLDHGSIGFYYEYLIKHSLQESVKNKNQVPLYETFMKEYCFFLFEERLKNINEDDFHTFLNSFTNKKRVTLNFSSLKNDLLKAKIIRLFNGQVSLHQPYIYYYFTSRAIDDRLEEYKTRKRVERMIDRIYVQEFEGIVLFLSHLSSNSFILETLKSKCQSYFKDYPEATIDQDIVKIDTIIEDEYMPLLEASDEPLIDINNKNKTIVTNKSSNDLEQDPDRDVDVINSLNQFVRAIKTFELMGNVVKINYAWDYSKKLPLVQETYGLGLRLMTAYFKMIETGGEEIISHIKQISTEKEINSISQLKAMTKSFTMQLTFAASYNLIRRISFSLGHKQLRPIFQNISKEKYSNANKLIEFSIDLLQLGIYSESDIQKFLSDSRGFNRPMARLILRNFVYEYTQLFKIDVKRRQQIHIAADIKIKNQRQIQQTSKRLKN